MFIAVFFHNAKTNGKHSKYSEQEYKYTMMYSHNGLS